jgi:hypothetical protein
MILPEIKHTSPSFIMACTIDEDLCDKIIENFDDMSKVAQYDKVRGYHRLNEGHLDSDILEDFMKAMKGAFELYKKQLEQF